MCTNFLPLLGLLGGLWPLLGAPSSILGPKINYHHHIWFLTFVPNLISLAWIEVYQEPPVLEVILGGCWWFLPVYLEGMVIIDFMDHNDMRFLTCVPNFSYLAIIEVFQEPPVLKVILRGRWWFLTGYLEDGVILDFMDHNDMWFLKCVPNLSSLPRTPHPQSHTWRILIVPD